MLRGCYPDAPRPIPASSSNKQIPFSSIVKHPKPHPSSKYPHILPLSHPPFSRRECDEYPHLPIFTLIPKNQLLKHPPHHFSRPLTPYPTTTYPQQIFSTPKPPLAPPLAHPPPHPLNVVRRTNSTVATRPCTDVRPHPLLIFNVTLTFGGGNVKILFTFAKSTHILTYIHPHPTP